MYFQCPVACSSLSYRGTPALLNFTSLYMGASAHGEVIIHLKCIHFNQYLHCFTQFLVFLSKSAYLVIHMNLEIGQIA